MNGNELTVLIKKLFHNYNNKIIIVKKWQNTSKVVTYRQYMNKALILLCGYCTHMQAAVILQKYWTTIDHCVLA